MADEQTPKSSDDAVDPSESPSLENQPLDVPSAAESAELAAQARSARPKRKSPSSGQATSSALSASSPTEDAGDAVEAQDPVRPAIARPVRRKPSGAGSTRGQQPDESSRNPIVASPRKREVSPAVVERKRTTPAAFVGQSADELRKVIWPTRQQLSAYFIVVLAFVLFIVAYVGALDVFFGWLLLKLFGK